MCPLSNPGGSEEVSELNVMLEQMKGWQVWSQRGEEGPAKLRGWR